MDSPDGATNYTSVQGVSLLCCNAAIIVRIYGCVIYVPTFPLTCAVQHVMQSHRFTEAVSALQPREGHYLVRQCIRSDRSLPPVEHADKDFI